MSWWGKVIGGAFGFMLGGPLGALIGAALGHNFDTGLGRLSHDQGPWVEERERAQTAFFTATFAVMGRLAKADGRVTRDEIQVANAVMSRMGLTADQRKAAQHLFNQGKRPDFPLDAVLDQLRLECNRSRNLLRMFLEIQIHAAYADGTIHPEERRLLLNICSRLGFSAQELKVLEAMIRAEHSFREGARGGVRENRAAPSVRDAYAMLGVTSDSDEAQVKRAYRRLMSQHHPDKLISKGLPEEMIKVATQKTQEIKAAYERIREARGF